MKTIKINREGILQAGLDSYGKNRGCHRKSLLNVLIMR